jgi:general L-amino acid transport system substrate-binding protein
MANYRRPLICGLLHRKVIPHSRDRSRFQLWGHQTMKRSTGVGGLFAGALLACTLSVGAHAQGSGSPTLDAVRARGHLVCGVNGDTAGFALPDSQGVMRGIDADHCRAVATAIFGDPTKLKYTPLTTQNRFTALQSGEVDVLIRETTLTLGREATQGFEFGPINYYDGTGFLVKKSAGVNAVKELDGATVCVQPGTSTELAIADYFRANNIKFTPIQIEQLSQIQQAFLSGRCDAYSTDSSALAGFRFTQGSHAEDYVLLPQIISKEPLAPAVRKGDDKWFDIVKWTSYAMMTAEENGITSKNVDSFANSTNPDIRRLLGLDGDLGKQLGLDNKWAYNVIKQVGNTAEVWDRNITPTGVPRGINALWNQGGLMYPPPMR